MAHINNPIHLAYPAAYEAAWILAGDPRIERVDYEDGWIRAWTVHGDPIACDLVDEVETLNMDRMGIAVVAVRIVTERVTEVHAARVRESRRQTARLHALVGRQAPYPTILDHIPDVDRRLGLGIS